MRFEPLEKGHSFENWAEKDRNAAHCSRQFPTAAHGYHYQIKHHDKAPIHETGSLRGRQHCL
jgi:hypothetical protein